MLMVVGVSSRINVRGLTLTTGMRIKRRRSSLADLSAADFQKHTVKVTVVKVATHAGGVVCDQLDYRSPRGRRGRPK